MIWLIMWKKQRLRILWTSPFQIRSLRLSSCSPRNPSSLYSRNSKPSTSTTHYLNFQGHKKNFQHPQPTTRWNQKQQSRMKRNYMLFTFWKLNYLTEKVKQFQAGCIKNHFTEWTSYTMGKTILGSVSGLSLGSSDNKLPHYHKRWKWSFPLKEIVFGRWK